MRVARIHHLGVAVRDLEEAFGTYIRLFGAEVEHRETLAAEGVEAIALTIGDSRVELLGSLGEDTPVGRFLAKRGPGMHHVAYEVGDLRAELEHRAQVDDQGVEAAAVLVGAGRVELLASLGPETPVGRFLAQRGPGMHHVAYEVDDVGVELERLSAAGAELIDAEPRQGLFGLQVAFVHPDAVHGVLTEVVSVG